MKRMLLAGAAVMVSLSVMPAQAEPVPWSDAEVERGTLVLDTWNDEEEGRQQALYFGGIEIDVAHPLPEGVPAEVLFRGPAAMNPLEVPARPMNPLE